MPSPRRARGRVVPARFDFDTLSTGEALAAEEVEERRGIEQPPGGGAAADLTA